MSLRGLVTHFIQMLAKCPAIDLAKHKQLTSEWTSHCPYTSI